MTDVLLVWSLAEIIQITSKKKLHDMIEQFLCIIKDIHNVTQQKNADLESKQQKLFEKHQNDTEHYNIIKNMKYEHALLYDNLIEIKSGQ